MMDILSLERLIGFGMMMILGGLYYYQLFQTIHWKRQALQGQDFYYQRLKSDIRFFKHMNHVLRTPLNGIVGFLELMKIKAYGDLPKPYQEYAALCEQNVTELHKIITHFTHYCDDAYQEIIVQVPITESTDDIYVNPMTSIGSKTSTSPL